MLINDKFTVMVVDDLPENLRLLGTMLKEKGYRIYVFPNGSLALKAAEQNPPDLILLDINMPGMNGYEVCKSLKANENLAEIPVIFVSALNDSFDKLEAFRVGGVDYISKPFQVEEVLARVETHLKLRLYQTELEQHNNRLSELVEAKVKELTESQMSTIFALAKLAESRDEETGKHIERVRLFSQLLTQKLRANGLHPDVINDDFVENIYHASPLHDIGKVAIRDAVLLKPQRLNSEEIEEIKYHTVFGAETLEKVYQLYPKNKFISMGVLISRSHHEKWDGTGYPDGLSGKEIPLCARIMSVADVYDALRTNRCYRMGLSHSEVVRYIREDSGKHFDPDVVKAFIELNESFDSIYLDFSDTQTRAKTTFPLRCAT
jgi:cyclic di-GMP phosphodiesterase